MKNPTIGMSYHCPLKTSALQNTSDGKYCSQCSKHIPDMRNSSTNEIIDEIQKSPGEFCGTFNPLQLENPFGDKRDKIVNWFQRLSIQQKSKRNVVLFFAFIVVVLTGCRTRTRGIPGYSYNGIPILRIHPRSVIEYTDASDFVKHRVYNLHFYKKKEKKKEKMKIAPKRKIKESKIKMSKEKYHYKSSK